MFCLKCGADTKSDRIFCQHCLEVMATFPVKPSAHISLPDRSEPPAPKKTWRRSWIFDPDVQLAQLRKVIRNLIILVFVLIVLLGATLAMFFTSLQPKEVLNIGRNYTYQSNAD